MTQTHTPSPWKKEERLGATVVYSVACAVDVATVHQGYPHGKLLEERQANARLIAAAPDLLEALEACMEVAFYGPSFPVSSQDNRTWKDSIEVKCRAAVARAKGEA